ncbi:hypothetical protein GCM10007972_02120 [Iodidimonas muriae]|uniref:histidine kinase n=2 Tax=Iodidimonas muriae TaxID=261467 RepID=A0ABQ2L6I8_9PROT|nr:hypothetical protein GCM10007972_02120 [Iodidimonas muriae]
MLAYAVIAGSPVIDHQAHAQAESPDDPASGISMAVIEQASQLVDSEPLRAMALIDEQISILPSKQGGNVDVSTIRLYMLKSSVLSRLGQNNDALRVATYAFGLFEAADLDPKSRLHADLLTAKARAHEHLGDMASALTDYFAAWGVFDALGDNEGMAAAHASGAGIYQEIGQWDNAISNYQRALIRAEQADDSFLRARIINNLAYAYVTSGQAQKAYDLLMSARPLIEELNNPLVSAYVDDNIGEALVNLGRYDDALLYIERGITAADALGVGSLVSNAWLNMARVHEAKGALDLAVDYATRGLEQAQENRERARLRDLHGILARLYAATDDYKLAYEHQSQSQKFREAINTAEVNQLGKVLEAQMDLERKEQEIALLQRDQEISALRLASESTWRNAALIGTFLLLGVIVGLTILLRAKARATAEAEIRSGELLLAQQELEHANEVKSNILAMTSHEVRTPLNGIMGMAQVLLRAGMEPKEKRQVETILNSANMLLALLNDILDMSKIEAGKLDIQVETFALRDLLTDLADLWQAKANDKGVALQMQVAPNLPLHIVGDPGRIRQVLSNLISNAIKFSSHGAVRVSVCKDDTVLETPAVVFRVKDQGIGISEAHKSQLFEPFTQVETGATRTYGGTGLGLSICRHLVGLMGGQIDFVSRLGEGTDFWFALPLVDSAINVAGPDGDDKGAVLQGASTVKNEQASRARLLIAEDNETNRLVMREMLHGQGYDLVFAEDGAQALELVVAQSFDLILMDVHMPVMDGPMAVREIRALGTKKAQVPVIAITADAMEGDRHQLISGGMNDYISKPIDRIKLIGLIEAFLAGKQGAEISLQPMADMG